jgi:prophage maintenance system killer protein
MALDAAEDGRAIGSSFIRALHGRMTGPQETYITLTPRGEQVLPIRSGEYKQTLNFRQYPDGSVDLFAPVRLVPEEIDRLADQLKSDSFTTVHPAVQAAYAHLGVTHIHPFADGNGRVGRALASVYLSRAAGVPLLVLNDQWASYGRALSRGNDGHHQQELIDFIYARGIDAMDLATSLLSPLPAALRARLESSEPVATPDSIVEAAAARLVFDALGTELRERLVSPPAGIRLALTLSSPDDQAASAGGAGAQKPLKQVLDPETGNDAVVLALQSDRPPARRVERRFVAVVSTTPGDVMPVGILEVSTGAHLELSLADVDPLVTEMARIRMRAWVSALVAGTYAEIA